MNTNSTDFAPADGFWDSFVSDYWEQKPVLLKGLWSEPIVTEDEVFQAMLSKAERAKSDRFWVSQNEETAQGYRMVPMEMFGPKLSDGGFQGFFERIRGNLGDREIGLNVHNLQLGSSELWFRFRDFIHGLISLVGLPTQQWDTDTFFGTYKFTPFGIHQDNASVFAVGVMGRRTYYAWPDDYFKKGDPALHSPDYDKVVPHLEHAVRMELGPGDVAYWPSSHWHVVGSDGQPSVVAQVSAYFGVQLSQLVGQMVGNALSQNLPEDSLSVFKVGAGLAPSLRGAVDTLGKLVTGGLIEQRLQSFWLSRVSADGFTKFPGLAAVGPLPSVIAINPRRPLHWAQVAGDALLIGANGHVFAASKDRQDLLQRLNAGESLSVDQLSDEPERQLLQVLHRRRAFP